MTLSYPISTLARCAVLPALLLGTLMARAQAPVWSGAAAATTNLATNTSVIRSVAADASGNLFVAGAFAGAITLGDFNLVSAGGNDLFVAKYAPSTGTWIWAQRGGGTGDDVGTGLALSGSSVYVTAYFTNNTTNANSVTVGGANPSAGVATVRGATATVGYDLLLSKFIDNGSSASPVWSQVAGGTGSDFGYGVAASGSSVYVTGFLFNNLANANAVVLDGGGTTPGTSSQAGATATASTDLLLAKYTDNGSSATYRWSQVGGGTGDDLGMSLAVSGSSVYVTGYLTNDVANTRSVVFGGTGSTPGSSRVNGASATASTDLLLAKYLDQGATSSLGWTQVGGGIGSDQGLGVAASGSNVYVTGYLTNNTSNANTVVLGGSGTTPGTSLVRGAAATLSADLLLAKYTDQGVSASLSWVQVAGGAGNDQGNGLTVNGSSIYVAGSLANNLANSNTAVFGGNGSTPGTSAQPGATATAGNDLLLAKYLDQGTNGRYAWSQVGGSTNFDTAFEVAISGRQVYAPGAIAGNASFGPAALVTRPGTGLAVLPYVLDVTLTPLPTRAFGPTPALALYPNPTGAGCTILGGATPGTAVRVLDALGRVVTMATADATGTAVLCGLAPGFYLVRVNGSSLRLAVE